MKQPEFDIDIDQTENETYENKDEQFVEKEDKFECQFEKKYALTKLGIINLALIRLIV